MLTEQEREKALKQLERVEKDKAVLSSQLWEEREAARKRKDFKLAKQLSKRRAELGRAHVLLLNAKRRVTASGTNKSAIAELKVLADEADKTVKNFNDLASALGAFSTFIRILTKLTGAFA